MHLRRRSFETAISGRRKSVWKTQKFLEFSVILNEPFLFQLSPESTRRFARVNKECPSRQECPPCSGPCHRPLQREKSKKERGPMWEQGVGPHVGPSRHLTERRVRLMRQTAQQADCLSGKINT